MTGSDEKPKVTLDAIPEGMIPCGSPAGRLLGFTSRRFAVDSYLWRVGGDLLVSLIISRRAGNFGQLVRDAQDAEFRVLVPNPLPQMEAILRRWGATREYHVFDGPIEEPVEVWAIPTLPPRPEKKSFGTRLQQHAGVV